MSNDINVTDGTILEALNNKVDMDFDNVSSNSVSFARMSREVTNCITEIPQRIKYTLEDGTLTIKAGSVVIVPYGVEDLTSQYPKGSTFIHENFKVYDTQFEDSKFFVWAELVNDIASSATVNATEKRFAFIGITSNSISSYANSESGTADTTINTYVVYYNTALNLVSGSQTTTPDYTFVRSLPILINYANGTAMFASINQVFNGIGYIGSIIWVDKGVKVLIPDGRNEDGSLKNIELVTTNIKTRTVTYAYNEYSVIKLNGSLTELNKTDCFIQEEIPNIIQGTWQRWFNIRENWWYYHNNTQTTWIKADSNNKFAIMSSTIRGTNGIITSLQPKQPFRAVDYNDKTEVSGWAMPSSKYIDLTLGASSSSYTAPANGWYVLRMRMKEADKQGSLENQTSGVFSSSNTSFANGYSYTYVPARRGDTVKIFYSGTPDTTTFRFIYAEGEI